MKSIRTIFKSNFILLWLFAAIIFTGCDTSDVSSNYGENSTILYITEIATTNEYIPETELITEEKTTKTPSVSAVANSSTTKINLKDIPKFSDSPYVKINANIPYFDKSDLTTAAFETYSPLDNLGRCGIAYANICKQIMPTEERGAIGHIKPSGWKTIKYEFVDGKYLYNRCHLVGFQLSGENDNERNLITGTRYMNTQGMLPFENMVADYVKETNNHVLYRITPIYQGNNLVASGVQMEALSVEDKGDGICFNVFVYNNQPGVKIDYANGDSKLSEDYADNSNSKDDDSNNTDNNSNNSSKANYIINKNTEKFHYPSCYSVDQMKEHNKIEFTGDRDELVSSGYSPCKNCNP